MKKFLLLILVLGVAGYAYWRYTTSRPTYALRQAQQAIQAHDAAAFDRYVDVEAISTQLLTDLTAQRSLLGALNPASWVVRGLSGMARPALAAGAKRQVDAFVETGSLEKARAEGGKFSLAGLVTKVVSDSSEFKGVTYERVLDNGTAEVGIAFTQPRYDTTLVVNLRLRDRGDHWQVTEIVRPGEIFGHVGRMEKDRLLKRLVR